MRKSRESGGIDKSASDVIYAAHEPPPNASKAAVDEPAAQRRDPIGPPE